jgi:hypothetical protein
MLFVSRSADTEPPPCTSQRAFSLRLIKTRSFCLPLTTFKPTTSFQSGHHPRKADYSLRAPHSLPLKVGKGSAPVEKRFPAHICIWPDLLSHIPNDPSCLLPLLHLLWGQLQLLYKCHYLVVQNGQLPGRFCSRGGVFKPRGKRGGVQGLRGGRCLLWRGGHVEGSPQRGVFLHVGGTGGIVAPFRGDRTG